MRTLTALAIAALGSAHSNGTSAAVRLSSRRSPVRRYRFVPVAGRGRHDIPYGILPCAWP